VPQARPVTLLLIDDTPANLVALKALLDKPDYILLTARSGEEALAIAQQENVDVILLDVIMPGMDGFEVARRLKAVEHTRHVPILFLTAVATDVSYAYRAYEVGAVDYIIKPLDPQTVRKKVAVFVDLVRHREMIERQGRALLENQRREYQLRLSELQVASDRRYRKLVEGIDNALAWSANEALELTFVSRQAPAMLGFETEDFLREDFWSRQLHPEDRDKVLALFHRALAESSDSHINHRLHAADGSVRWLNTGISGVAASGDRPAELHGFSVDITELKRAEEEARRAKDARDNLLAVVSHDLRDPLNAISMGATTIATTLAKSADPAVASRRDNATRILQSAQRMKRLIDQLLDLAQMEAGGLAVEQRPVEVAGLLHDVQESFRPIVEQKGQVLNVRAPRGLMANIDRDRIFQVVANLVSNALRFTPKGGTVEVRADAKDGDALFTVKDTGPGITEEEMPQIWSRYWKAKRDVGVGLGLAIAKGLVEAHGGRIWAESKPGAGATFHFTLPSISSAEAHPPS
jgi:PAS domain S-box-containing protein